MGIVMTIFMALALLLSVPNPARAKLKTHKDWLSSLILLAGIWNLFWYGSQHLGEFWGNMACVSGALMILASFPLLPAKRWPAPVGVRLLALQKKARGFPQGLFELSLAGLFLCFCFYSYTLLMLNLS